MMSLISTSVDIFKHSLETKLCAGALDVSRIARTCFLFLSSCVLKEGRRTHKQSSNPKPDLGVIAEHSYECAVKKAASF